MSFFGYPFRLFLQFVSLCVVLAAVVVLAFGAFALRNYFRSPSPVAYDNLARGTVAVRSQTGEGTGFVIRNASGWEVVTAAHVVGASTNVEVFSRSGLAQTAAVKSIDPERDVAVLTTRPDRSWVALPVTNSLPYPSEKVLTQCFFDASAREGPFVGPVADLRRGEQHFLSIDLTAIVDPVRAYSPRTGLSVVALFGVEPGCSGAPLVDRQGRLVAVILAGNNQTAVAGASSSIP